MFSADPASPTGYVSKCCVTQNQMCMKPRMLQVLVSARIQGRRWGIPRFHTAIGSCTLVGMLICELTAVALTAARLPPPRSPRRAQASTSPRLASS